MRNETQPSPLHSVMPSIDVTACRPLTRHGVTGGDVAAGAHVAIDCASKRFDLGGPDPGRPDTHMWHVRAVMYGVGKAGYAELLAQKRMGSLTASTVARVPAQITGHRSSARIYRHRHVARKSGQ
jgi:hypothetical protein